MFEDKLRFNWRNASLRLLVRKATRRFASTDLMLRIFARTHQLACAANAHVAPQAISRWILGGYLFQCFRDGLRSLKNESHLPLFPLELTPVQSWCQMASVRRRSCPMPRRSLSVRSRAYHFFNALLKLAQVVPDFVTAIYKGRKYA